MMKSKSQLSEGGEAGDRGTDTSVVEGSMSSLVHVYARFRLPRQVYLKVQKGPSTLFIV